MILFPVSNRLPRHTAPAFARGAHVVWSGNIGIVESDAVWSSFGWSYTVRFGTGLSMPVAESALSAAPGNIAMPAVWRAPRQAQGHRRAAHGTPPPPLGAA